MLGTAASTLLHGTTGLGIAYGSVALPMVVAMARRGASVLRVMTAPLAAVPVTAAVSAGLGLASALAPALGLQMSALASIGLGAATSVAAGYLAGTRLARGERTVEQFRRGAVVREDVARTPDAGLSRGAGLSLSTGLLRGRSDRNRGAQITLAGMPVAPQDETKHFKIIGATGTGKSTALNEILAASLGRGDRVIIADPDGGYLGRFYDRSRGDVILNPFDSRSHRWDLFGEIEQPHDIEQLARSLIPDHEGSDRAWSAYARTFFSAVTGRAMAAGIRDVGELHQLLTMEPVEGLSRLLAKTPAQPFLDEHNGRMFGSIRAVTSSAVASLQYVSQQSGEALSVRQWVRRGPQSRGALFIPYQAGQIAALRSQISAWMRLGIFEAMNRPEADQRLWFVVDELDALGQIDGLKDALARLRKFGGRCALGFQSIAQVSSTYGDGDAHTIVENCSNTLLLRSSASEGGGTARFASRLIGEREVLRSNVSRSRQPLSLFSSRSVSQQVSTEAAVLPSQIEQLPDLVGYLKLASRHEWQRVQLVRGAGQTTGNTREKQDAGLEI